MEIGDKNEHNDKEVIEENIENNEVSNMEEESIKTLELELELVLMSDGKYDGANRVLSIEDFGHEHNDKDFIEKNIENSEKTESIETLELVLMLVLELVKYVC